jgi:hypothetical protein
MTNHDARQPARKTIRREIGFPGIRVSCLIQIVVKAHIHVCRMCDVLRLFANQLTAEVDVWNGLVQDLLHSHRRGQIFTFVEVDTYTLTTLLYPTASPGSATLCPAAHGRCHLR